MPEQAPPGILAGDTARLQAVQNGGAPRKVGDDSEIVGGFIPNPVFEPPAG